MSESSRRCSGGPRPESPWRQIGLGPADRGGPFCRLRVFLRGLPLRRGPGLCVRVVLRSSESPTLHSVAGRPPLSPGSTRPSVGVITAFQAALWAITHTGLAGENRRSLRGHAGGIHKGRPRHRHGRRHRRRVAGSPLRPGFDPGGVDTDPPRRQGERRHRLRQRPGRPGPPSVLRRSDGVAESFEWPDSSLRISGVRGWQGDLREGSGPSSEPLLAEPWGQVGAGAVVERHERT